MKSSPSIVLQDSHQERFARKKIESRKPIIREEITADGSGAMFYAAPTVVIGCGLEVWFDLLLGGVFLNAVCDLLMSEESETIAHRYKLSMM